MKIKGNSTTAKKRRLACVACKRAKWHRATSIDNATQLLQKHHSCSHEDVETLIEWCFDNEARV